MDLAIALVQIFNTAAPGVASLIMMIKKKDGTVSVVVMLDEAEAKFKENLTQAQQWLAAHPTP